MNSTKILINQHRKKKYVFKDRESPFPVPIASITREAPNKNYWYHYTGQIQGEHVIVTHTGDISYLQRMGFFGKGLMSRGAPSVYKNLPYVHIPSTKDNEPDVVHVMRRRRYLKHMKWKKSHDKKLTNQEEPGDDDVTATEDEEFDSDVDYTNNGCDHEDVNSNFPQSNSEHIANSSSVKDNELLCSDSSSVAWQQVSTNQNSSTWSWNEECSKQEVREESWENQTTNENTATASWDNMEADEDFWATEEVPGDKKKIKENNLSNTNETALENSEDCDTQMNEKKRPQDDDFDNPNKKVKLSTDGNDSDSVNKDITNGPVSQLNHSGGPNINNSVSNKEDHADKCNNQTNNVEGTHEGRVHAELEVDNINIFERTKPDVGNKTDEMKMGDEIGDETETNNEIRNSSDCDSGDKLDKANTDFTEMETDQPEALPIHPYCKDDDDDDDVDDNIDDGNGRTANTGDEFLVIDDSDIDDSAWVVPKKEKYAWLPVKKKEIFNFNEPLMLSLEEAYFLSYGLGCLTVKDESNSSLTITDLWCRFCNKKQFLPRYVAYHYFRSKGWVPKPTILFGTDFLVYKVGPEFYHASYSVIVKTVYEGTFEEVEEYNSGKISWTGFFGINRVTEQVAKTLVYCYVIMPKDLSDEEKKSPDCITRFKIRLQAVQRWISSQERDKEKILEDELVT